MKKLAATWAAAALIALPALTLADNTQQYGQPQGREGKVVAETAITQTATVKAVDLENRTLTLELPDGSQQTLAVDPAVRKLDQVKAGDVITTRYREAVSVRLNKTKVPAGVKVETSVTPDETSAKPAATAGVRVTTTATITRISADGSKVTLRTPDGTTADVQVQDPDNLAMIKRGEVHEGDQVTITYDRAVALSVEKAPAK